MTAITTPAAEAVDAMLELDGYYRLNLWPAESVADRRHDLLVMERYGDLKAVSTELWDPAGVTVLTYRIDLTGAAGRRPPAWPLIPRDRVAGGRFTVTGADRAAAYRGELRLAWKAADPRPAAAADEFASGAGGRFRVGAVGRERLVVKRAGALGFAFADAPGLGVEVYLHAREAPPGLTFHPGQALTAVLVRDGDGPRARLQARAIRPA